MIGFIIGTIFGCIMTVSIMSILLVSKEDNVDILLYDRNKVTLEDCDIMYMRGYTTVLDSGELLGFTKEY